MVVADVAASVAAIIAAFTSCRKLILKVRTKTRPKMFKTRNAVQDQELYLDESLSRAPLEISNEYAQGMTMCGQPFGIGDAFAQTVLQATLAKLNSGLVDIIHKFLTSKDPSKLKLDYNALSTLSDVSRVETMGALAQLRDRLARAMAAHAMRGQRQAPALPNKKALPAPAKGQGQKPKDTQKEYVAGVRHANHMHWAVVRPRAAQKKRHLSNSSIVSSTSNGSNSTSSSGSASKFSNTTTAVGSQQPPQPTRAQPKKTQAQPPQRAQAKQQANQHPPTRLPLKQEHLAHVPPLPRPYPAENAHHLWSINAEAGSNLVPAQTSQAVPRRRAERPTESFYSYTSDSTKLGEIPPHRWQHPYDLEEMDRLNAAAYAAGWANINVEEDARKRAAQQQRARKSPGLLARMLRISPMAGIAEA